MLSGGRLGNIPGLRLVAWAILNGTTGAVIAGNGITFNTRTGPGVYTMNVGAGLVTSVNQCVTEARRNGVGGLSSDAWCNMSTTTSMELRTFSNGAAGDCNSVWVAVYAP